MNRQRLAALVRPPSARGARRAHVDFARPETLDELGEQLTHVEPTGQLTRRLQMIAHLLIGGESRRILCCPIHAHFSHCAALGAQSRGLLSPLL
jgi:hypothetical protein